MNNFLEDFYEAWVDRIINSRPLSSFANSSTRTNVQQILQINQNIVNNFYELGRHLRIENEDENNNDNLDVDINDFNENMEVNYHNNYTNNRLHHIDNRLNHPNMNFDINISSGSGNNQPLVEWDSYPVNNLINNLFGLFFDSQIIPIDDLQDIKVSITEELFNKFKNIKITNTNDFKDKLCNICIDEYKQDDIITILPCEHFFHTECIKNWLCREKVTCPTCRMDVRYKN